MTSIFPSSAVSSVSWTVAPVAPEPPDARLPQTALAYTSADETVQAPVTDPPTVYTQDEGVTLDVSTSWRSAGTLAKPVFVLAPDNSQVTRGSVLRQLDVFFAGMTDDGGAPADGDNIVAPVFVDVPSENEMLIVLAPSVLLAPVTINDDWQLSTQLIDDVRVALVTQRQAVPTTLLKLHMGFSPPLALLQDSLFGVVVAPYNKPEAQLGAQATAFGVAPASPPVFRVRVGWRPAHAAGAAAAPLVVWWTLSAGDREADTDAETTTAILARLAAAGVTHWLVRNVLSPRQEVRVPLDQLYVYVPVACSRFQHCVQFAVAPGVPSSPSRNTTSLRVSNPSNTLHVLHRPRQSS